MIRTVGAALLAAAVGVAAPARGGVAEEWYLSRGRANMRIGNYAAAIEAFRKALDEDPRNREASRSLGVACARNGETDRAVAEFDRHLSRFSDDAEIAFEQARILQWSRYAYRSGDAIRYLRMGLAAKDDPARRRDLARLLARDRATLAQALAEYDRLLARTPEDPDLRAERLRLLLWDPRRREEAIRELERREAERPGDEKVQRDLARLEADDPVRAHRAVSRLDALLGRHPDDPDLLLGRARALARDGRREEARAAYARALAARPSTDVRLEYAGLLARDPATREEARAEYEEVLRSAPRNRRARLALARVLMARRETSGAAVAQYREVLQESPSDAEAHRGLARAYAWNGDADRALAHGALSERYGPATPDVERIERSLRRGREPALGFGARVLDQSGGAFSLSSTAELASGSAEPTPFTSTTVEAGVASYRGDAGQSDGPFFGALGEWRPSPGHRLRAALSLDGARLPGERISGEVRWEREDGGRTLSLGLARAPRRDSFRAYAGEVVSGQRVGAASDEVAAVRAVWAADRNRLELSGRAGLVSGAGMPDVFTAGAAARADRALLRNGAWTLSLGGAIEATHHGRDLSGLPDGDPTAPRIFSPPLFASVSPRVSILRDAGLAGRIEVDAGPAVQVTTGRSAAARAGGDVRASIVQRIGDRVRLGATVRAERIADVYTRAEASLGAALLF